MENQEKVIVACPKCGQKLRCVAGGVGTCLKCGTQIAFSNQEPNSSKVYSGEPRNKSILYGGENGEEVYRCPYCDHLQYGKEATCSKCGKSMKQPFHLGIGFIICTILSVLSGYAYYRTDESSFVIFLVILGGIGICGIIPAISRTGKYISGPAANSTLR